MAVLVNSFNFNVLDGNEIIEAVDAKAEAAYQAAVKEELKKQKAEERKRQKEEEEKRKEEEEKERNRQYYNLKWAYGLSRREKEKIKGGEGFYERLPKNYESGETRSRPGSGFSNAPDQGRYDQQRSRGGFAHGGRGRGRGREGGYGQQQWRRIDSGAENNNGNNKGAEEVVVEKQQREVEGGVEQGNNAQVQSNGENKSSDGKPRRNINGSQRRKLKKKNKAEEAAKTEGSNNAPAEPAGGNTSAPASAVSGQEIAELTLKEYEEKFVVPKKKGLEAEKKILDSGNCERIKEFEAMQAIGKKKLEEEVEKKSSAAPKPKEKSVDQVNKKKAININEFLKTKPIKTQIVNINEPSRLQKDVEVQEDGGRYGGYQQSQRGGRYGGYQQSQRGGRFGGRGFLQRDGGVEGYQQSQRGGYQGRGFSQRGGRFGGYQQQSQRGGQHQSQQTPVKHQPKINLAEFPSLGGKS